jgi:GNAT superfamily N-acetyltransferase
VGPEARFVVQRAGRSDLEEFVDQRLALFDEASRPEPPTGLADATRRACLRGFEARTLLVWLARTERGEVVGSLALHLFPRLPSPASPTGEEGYVVHAYTLPAWRRRGVGALLMHELIAEAHRLGLGRLRLHATPDGRALYSRFGFVDYAGNMQLVL